MLKRSMPCCGAFYCTTRCCATHFLPPYISSPRILGDTGSHIDPPHNLASNEIHVNAIPETQRRAPSDAAAKRRAQIVPVGRAASIASSVIGLTPHKTECFSAHSLARPATQDGVAVLRIQGLEALRQANLAEIRRALGRRRFGQVGVFLRRSHHLSVGIEL